MLKKLGYTLTEILVVLVVIGTLAALAWPNYAKIQEKSLNREAKASLALIRAAEKIYKLEQGFYYPYVSAPENPTADPAAINSNLKLSLRESDPKPTWSVGITTTSTTSGTATRTRTNGPDARVWSHLFSNEEPTCSGGSNCP